MLDIETIVIVSVLAFLATCTVILKKHILTFVSPKQLLYLDCFFGVFPILLFLILSRDFVSLVQKFKELNWSKSATIFGYSTLMTIGALGVMWLVKYKSISEVMPLAAAMSTFFTFVAGVLLYKEKITYFKCIAVIAICLGIYLMNY